jgi:hypothetical protein
MNGDVVFSVGSTPHKTLVDNKITGWLGISDPKESDHRREILFPAFTEEATDMSTFDLLPMEVHLPFNRGLPVGSPSVARSREKK